MKLKTLKKDIIWARNRAIRFTSLCYVLASIPPVPRGTIRERTAAPQTLRLSRKFYLESKTRKSSVIPKNFQKQLVACQMNKNENLFGISSPQDWTILIV
jgi:hypothetical protein